MTLLLVNGRSFSDMVKKRDQRGRVTSLAVKLELHLLLVQEGSEWDIDYLGTLTIDVVIID